MIDRKQQRCANCRYFCQDTDPENRMYYDDKSGECRRHPPTANFAWNRTRLYHWCGEWEGASANTLKWQRLSTHPRTSEPVLLYRRGAFCKQSGMFVAYWNASYTKWHDDSDRLFENSEFTHWANLPIPPEE
jgi:hypothetical protein